MLLRPCSARASVVMGNPTNFRETILLNSSFRRTGSKTDSRIILRREVIAPSHGPSNTYLYIWSILAWHIICNLHILLFIRFYFTFYKSVIPGIRLLTQFVLDMIRLIKTKVILYFTFTLNNNKIYISIVYLKCYYSNKINCFETVI